MNNEEFFEKLKAILDENMSDDYQETIDEIESGEYCVADEGNYDDTYYMGQLHGAHSLAAEIKQLVEKFENPEGV